MPAVFKSFAVNLGVWQMVSKILYKESKEAAERTLDAVSCTNPHADRIVQ